jgi:hypothetical protein
MHGRTVAALILIALALPARAVADTMPPGDYTVHITSGSLRIGALPPTALPDLPPFEVALADQPVTAPLPLPYTFSVAPIPGLTLTTTLDSGQATIDPLTGAITADVSLHTVLKAVPGPILNVSGTCTYGAADQPITMHLATAPGSQWQLPGRNFTVSDSTFAIPTPVCDDPTLQSLVVNGAGDTSAGHNLAAMVGTAARPEDAPPPPPPPPDLGGGSSGGSTPGGTSGSNGSGGSEPGTTSGTQRAPAAATPRCVVPKLKGRTLAAAKRALKRAGCRAGKVSKRRSRKHAGTVLAQSKRAGRRLARGTRVRLVVAARP